MTELLKRLFDVNDDAMGILQVLISLHPEDFTVKEICELRKMAQEVLGRNVRVSADVLDELRGEL